MSSSALDMPIKKFEKINNSFKENTLKEFYVRDATMDDDVQLTRLIAKSTPCSGVQLAFERYPSYLKASNVHYNNSQALVVVSDHDPQKVLAMLNIGTRQCYVNGSKRSVHYIADFRLSDFKRKHLSQLLMGYLELNYSSKELYQSVVLSHTSASFKKIADENTGAPKRYITDQIETHTLTSFKNQKELNPSLIVSTMASDDINLVNRFVGHMSDYYNFLPAYNFNGILNQDPYWTGLSFDDFLVFRRNGQIVGLCGLWDQTAFKQTRIIDYGKLISWVRPAYNYWAKLNQQLSLPSKGEVVNCVMLHSVLCNPYDVDLFDSILRTALHTANSKKFQAICFTLAENDPRRDCSGQFISQKIPASHGFHCFEGSALSQFDSKRISYLESGRI